MNRIDAILFQKAIKKRSENDYMGYLHSLLN